VRKDRLRRQLPLVLVLAAPWALMLELQQPPHLQALVLRPPL
jgi:hypothetical protein